jgi:hypothetical protein
MRSAVLGLVWMVGSLAAQPVSVGVKAGVPFIDFVRSDPALNGYAATGFSNRYLVGGTVEVHLPKRLSLEADVLYRRATYNSNFFYSLVGGVQEHVRTGLLEVPLLVKYRFGGRVHLFVDGGPAFDHLVGLKNSFINTSALNLSPPYSGTNSTPTSLSNSTTPGVVAGVGIEARAGILRIAPELRYTRWTSAHFFFSSQNQVDFLLGITF